MTSEEDKDDVQVPMCGPSADLLQEWNESAAELRDKIQAGGFVQNDIEGDFDQKFKRIVDCVESSLLLLGEIKEYLIKRGPQ